MTKKQSSPWFLAGVVLLVAIVAGLLVWTTRSDDHEPAKKDITKAQVTPDSATAQTTNMLAVDPLDTAQSPASAQTTAEVAEVVEEELQPTSSASLTLDNSDAEVEAFLAQSSAAQLGKWLVPEHKIRKLVRAINALEEGKLVSQYRPTIAPDTPFKAERKDEQWHLSEANFARYQPYISALEQAGPEQLLALYRHYQPLLEQAYQELGVDKGSFEQVTRGALKQIINAPTVDDEPTLASTSVVFHYQDKQLEQLPELHKLMIRIGPENRERLQTLAQALLHQLEQQ